MVFKLAFCSILCSINYFQTFRIVAVLVILYKDCAVKYSFLFSWTACHRLIHGKVAANEFMAGLWLHVTSDESVLLKHLHEQDFGAD